MMAPSQPDPSYSQAREALLASLSAHCIIDARDGLDGNVLPMVSAFVTRVRECIASFRPTTAGLVVIEGSKQVARGGERRTCAAGDILFLPADAVLDVVNDPDPTTGIYRALYRHSHAL